MKQMNKKDIMQIRKNDTKGKEKKKQDFVVCAPDHFEHSRCDQYLLQHRQ